MKKIINKERGKIGLCVATGHSLKPYLDNVVNLSLEQKNKDKYVFLSTNHYDSMFNLNANYRIVANNVLNIESEFRRFNSTPKTMLLYSDSIDITNRNTVKQLMNVDYMGYDQRHFDSKPCPSPSSCCDHIINGRLTIQEELQKYTGHIKHYGAGSTGALHMVSFSILMGCNPIYVFGVDLNYSKGYVNPNFRNPNSFTPYLDDILNDFKIIKESADVIGVNIYSTCEGSPINNVIPYKKFKK
jgi:hypothetical protein